jgi:hypothetical protein
VEPRGLSSRLTMLLYPLTRRSPDHALGNALGGPAPRVCQSDSSIEAKDPLHICHMAIRHGPLERPASVQQNPTPSSRARFLKISEKRSCRALSHLVTLLVVLYSAASTALPASTNGE